jgi:hypothetical protein
MLQEVPMLILLLFHRDRHVYYHVYHHDHARRRKGILDHHCWEVRLLRVANPTLCQAPHFVV